MTKIEAYHTHLESAMHSIGHATHHAALGYTLDAEHDLELAIESIKAAHKMLGDNFHRDMYKEV